jgi:hypothetical protein
LLSQSTKLVAINRFFHNEFLVVAIILNFVARPDCYCHK